MKKKIPFLAITSLTSIMLLASSTTVFAGTWKQDSKGWWYQNDNASYPVSQWQWIDGNNDGTAECYYFNSEGYCLINTTTPDGYTVNADGAWTINGIIQTKTLEKESNNVPQTTQPAPAETKPAETQAPQSEDKGYLTEEEVRQREQEDNGFVDYTEGFTPGNGNPVGEQITMDQLEKYKLN